MTTIAPVPAPRPARDAIPRVVSQTGPHFRTEETARAFLHEINVHTGRLTGRQCIATASALAGVWTAPTNLQQERLDRLAAQFWAAAAQMSLPGTTARTGAQAGYGLVDEVA